MENLEKKHIKQAAIKIVVFDPDGFTLTFFVLCFMKKDINVLFTILLIHLFSPNLCRMDDRSFYPFLYYYVLVKVKIKSNEKNT